MASTSLIIAVLIVFGYILHSTMHPEDVITGSQSEHFAPSLWFYFVPAQATHFPYNIFSPIFSAAFESSFVIASSCAAVAIFFGSQVERGLLGIVPTTTTTTTTMTSPSGNSKSSWGNASVWFFAKVFLLSHGTFLATSFLAATMSTALVKSTHPHPEKEKHEQEETMKIGYAYFGPLAFATGIAVASWCKTAINNNPFEEDDGGGFAFRNNKGISIIFPARFIPFYLVVLAFARDLFFCDHPPTHSEFMLGIATRGPLFFGVLNGMWVTWFYFRFVESRTEFENNNNNNNNNNNDNNNNNNNVSPTLITNYGNSSGRFAFHRCCPIPVVSDKVLLPLGNFLYSSVLRIFTSYGGNQIDNKWTEFLANVVTIQEAERQTSHDKNNNINANGTNRTRRSNSFNSSLMTMNNKNNTTTSAFSNAIPPSGTTIVSIGNDQQQKSAFAPLPGSNSADADRRRELAMAALQQRLSSSASSTSIMPSQSTALKNIINSSTSTIDEKNMQSQPGSATNNGDVVVVVVDVDETEKN